jgi:ubiquitin-protein ligase
MTRVTFIHAKFWLFIKNNNSIFLIFYNTLWAGGTQGTIVLFILPQLESGNRGAPLNTNIILHNSKDMNKYKKCVIFRRARVLTGLADF